MIESWVFQRLIWDASGWKKMNLGSQSWKRLVGIRSLEPFGLKTKIENTRFLHGLAKGIEDLIVFESIIFNEEEIDLEIPQHFLRLFKESRDGDWGLMG